MTKEEAQIVIGNIPIKPEVLDDCYDITEYQEAKAMAIKALEQQTSEDCVSRNTLKRAVSELTYWHPTTDGRLEVGGAFDNTVYKVEDVWRLTRELPPITPSRPKGKWIIKDKMWSVCSVCGCQTRMMKKYNVPNYCPACGADMRESEEQ